MVMDAVLMALPVASLINPQSYKGIHYICRSLKCGEAVLKGVDSILPKRRKGIKLMVIAALYGLKQFVQVFSSEELEERIASLMSLLEKGPDEAVIYSSTGSMGFGLEKPRRLKPLITGSDTRTLELRWMLIPLILAGSTRLLEKYVEKVADYEPEEEEMSSLNRVLEEYMGFTDAYVLPPPIMVEDVEEELGSVQEIIEDAVETWTRRTN